MTKKSQMRIKVGITVGDINGIGPEIILKTFSDNRICEICQPIAFGSKDLFKAYAKQFHLNEMNIGYYSSLEKVKGKTPAVVTIWDKGMEIKPGEKSIESGRHAYESLEYASKLLKEKEIDALVTAPINKETIQSKDFDFPGHTEFLQKTDEADQSLLLMVSDSAKIGLVTGHVPLSEVKTNLSSDLILSKLGLLNKSLKEDFAITKPKIAVLGLNPHAGDSGLMGKEEQEIIAPAIQQAKTIDIMAFGPYAADGFFASSEYKNFDGVLAMYHDQGLIPAKMLSSGSGVNFTAGLSFVRTSPDHGTAFEIAGKGIADESSFRNAIYRAVEIVKTRNQFIELEESAMPKNKTRNQ